MNPILSDRRPSCARPAGTSRVAALVGVAFTVAVLEPAVALADTDGAKSIEALTLTGYGRDRLLIADPSARSSDAWRINTDRAAKDGTIPAPTPGYRITSTVIVSAPPGPLADSLITDLGAKPIAGVPGFYRISTPSIAAAIEVSDLLATTPGIADVHVDTRRPVSLRTPTDPSFVLQWHLRNIVAPAIDINAEEAWDMGFTGADTLIGVVEGGWEVTHPDLAANYHAGASMTGGASTSHATSVAGLIAANADNAKGGVGIAYDAKITKLVYGTSSATAEALTWRNEIHHAKNNSWGPSDNGTVWPISAVEKAAIAESVNGRQGLGTVIVWAGGNGAYWVKDRADYDPFASSRFAICVGAIDDDDDHSYYSEPGSALLVVAHSSGGPGAGDRQIYTTTAGAAYTSTFGGTSTAAPLAAGTVGLMLQANPNLTWRDVQHVLVDAARRCDPLSLTWQLNGAGRLVSYDYGFGAIDAGAAVELATRWHALPPERSSSASTTVNTSIPDGLGIPVIRTVTIPDNYIVESVELTLNATTTFVGDLNISLVSPLGTESIFAKQRNDPGDNYTNTVFTSKRQWGERARGAWTIAISDSVLGDPAVWQNATVTVHGFCPSDVNRDSELDILDFLDFIEAFAPCNGVRAPCYGVGGIGADYNRDGSVDVLDLLDFVDDVSSAC